MTAAATSGINEDLLRRVLEHITAHPEEHDQARWAVRTDCGTAYCVAGHIVVMSGWQVDWSDGMAIRTDEMTHTCGVVGTDKTIASVAAELLGVERGECDDGLFYGGNELDDLWRIAAELTDGRVSRPTPTK